MYCRICGLTPNTGGTGNWYCNCKVPDFVEIIHVEEPRYKPIPGAPELKESPVNDVEPRTRAKTMNIPMPELKKSDEYSMEVLKQGIEWMKKYGVIKDEEQPMKPYIVTFEIRARNIIEAVELAREICDEIESVVQKYRMTNIGTEWYRK